ncbi:MAG TPA: hypothetical protein VGF29_15865 [Hyphomicrobiaceae bacterium]|jgi:hypothetical protein
MTDQVNGPAQEPADNTAAAARLLADWREAVASEIAALEAINAAPSDQDASRAWDDALTRVRALAREAWARPVSSLADLRLRAEIAQHALWANYYKVDGTRRFEAVLNGQPDENRMSLGPFDERAVAELVKAVLWTVQAAAAQRDPAARDWLDMLHDARPNGIAPGGKDTHGGGGQSLPWHEVEDLADRAKAGVGALRTLWDLHDAGALPAEAAASATSVDFCIDSIEALLDQMRQRLAAAPVSRREGEAAPPA